MLSVPRVFEKVYNAARQKAKADGKGAIFDRAEQVAIAYSEALETGGRGGRPGCCCACSTASSTGWSTASCGPRSAAAAAPPSPAARRSAPGWPHFFRGIGVTIYEGYGLTETSPAAAVNLHHHIRIGTVGRPLPGVTIRIADDGEILIAGDIVFQGYWNNEAATAEAIRTPTAGSAPATWGSSTATAICASPAARRRSS